MMLPTSGSIKGLFPKANIGKGKEKIQLFTLLVLSPIYLGTTQLGNNAAIPTLISALTAELHRISEAFSPLNSGKLLQINQN